MTSQDYVNVVDEMAKLRADDASSVVSDDTGGRTRRSWGELTHLSVGGCAFGVNVPRMTRAVLHLDGSLGKDFDFNTVSLGHTCLHDIVYRFFGIRISHDAKTLSDVLKYTKPLMRSLGVAYHHTDEWVLVGEKEGFFHFIVVDEVQTKLNYTSTSGEVTDGTDGVIWKVVGTFYDVFGVGKGISDYEHAAVTCGRVSGGDCTLPSDGMPDRNSYCKTCKYIVVTDGHAARCRVSGGSTGLAMSAWYGDALHALDVVTGAMCQGVKPSERGVFLSSLNSAPAQRKFCEEQLLAKFSSDKEASDWFESNYTMIRDVYLHRVFPDVKKSRFVMIGHDAAGVPYEYGFSPTPWAGSSDAFQALQAKGRVGRLTADWLTPTDESSDDAGDEFSECKKIEQQRGAVRNRIAVLESTGDSDSTELVELKIKLSDLGTLYRAENKKAKGRLGVNKDTTRKQRRARITELNERARIGVATPAELEEITVLNRALAK